MYMEHKKEQKEKQAVSKDPEKYPGEIKKDSLDILAQKLTQKLHQTDKP